MYCYQYVPHVPANHSASSCLLVAIELVLDLSSRAVVSKISKDMSHSFYYLLVMLGFLPTSIQQSKKRCRMHDVNRQKTE